MKKQDVIKLMKDSGVYATKDRGQNFLLDEHVIFEMVKAGKVTKDDLVVEIGPGFGVLTKELVHTSKQLLAIELDQKLADYLHKNLANDANLQIIHGDALSAETFHTLVQWLGGHLNVGVPADVKSPDYQKTLEKLDLRYKLIANLPYQITSRILRQFLESFPRPSMMVVMVQKEVAERMMAEPGQMSLLALSVQAYSQVRLVQQVPASSFFPQPKVDSAVVHCDVSKPNPRYWALDLQERAIFWQLAHAGFASKRKQLKNNLQSVFTQKTMTEIAEMLKELGLKETCRAQELSIEQWCGLAKVIYS